MLGWLISIVLLLSGCIHGDSIQLVTSGLFAIAGSIGMGLNMISTNMRTKKSEE